MPFNSYSCQYFLNLFCFLLVCQAILADERDINIRLFIRMKIKTSDTFFPTKFRPTTANTNPDRQVLDSANSRSYKLVKKRSSTQESSANTLNQYQSANIFKSAQLGDCEFNHERDRPVGGLDMFLKEHNKKTRTSSTRKIINRASSLEKKKREPDQDPKPSKFQERTERVEDQSKLQNIVLKEQVFKSHQSYKPVTAFKTTNPNLQSKKSSTFNSKDPRNVNHNNWVVKQTENFENKMSVLNEIYYKKPLVEKYGDRYFEYFLRDRFEDDFPPPIYIHQIKSDGQAAVANNDKFIAKLKKIHPNIKKFQKLVVKGKHLSNSLCPQQKFIM